jgi:hypothetical protein
MMKTKWLAVLGLIWMAQANAFEQIEANVKYPAGMGTVSSGFSSMVGFGASVYMAPMIDPSVKNYLSVAYNGYRIRADGSSSLKLIPVLFNLEAGGNVFKDLRSTIAVGAGIGSSFVNVTSQTSFNWSVHFAAQIKPGVEYVIDENITVVGHTPVTFYVSRAVMSSMDFDLGVSFKL